MGEPLRGAASSRTFAALDHYLWQLTYKWACFSHQNKSRAWIISRYYGRFNPASNDRWIVNPPESWRTPLCGLGPAGLSHEAFVVDG